MTRWFWLFPLTLALVLGCPTEEADDDDDAADDDSAADDDDSATDDDDSAADDDDTGDDDTSVDPPSYASHVDPMLQYNCQPCHTTSMQGYLSLVDGWEALVDEPSHQNPKMSRVSPYSIPNSYLIHKLEGSQKKVGGSGADMPENAKPLTLDELDLIRNWIAAGADP